MMDPSDWNAPTSAVVEAALGDVRELVRVEIALAKDELLREGRAAREAALAWCVAIVLLTSGLTLLLLAIAVSLSSGALPVATVGFVFLLGAAGAMLHGLKVWPEGLLGQTERRIERDIERFKEHLA